jgi:hypothetical protein
MATPHAISVSLNLLSALPRKSKLFELNVLLCWNRFGNTFFELNNE